MPANEYFVLIEQDFSFADEETAIIADPFEADDVSAETVVSTASVTSSVATVTTTTDHGLRVGMGVIVEEIEGIDGINVPAIVATTPSTTQFTFSGTFSGTYTTGGVVIPREIARGFTVPGVAMMRRSMLSFNEGVVPPPPLPSNRRGWQ